MATQTSFTLEKQEKERSSAIIILSKIWQTIKLRYKKQFILIVGLAVFLIILEIFPCGARIA